jgi:hypothetical protein
MTYCNTLVDPLITRIETEQKSLDEIAGEICGDTVKNPRQKIIRIIKLLLGNKYLIDHALTLGYHPDKAVRQKSTTCEVVNRKIVTEKIEDPDNSGQSNSVRTIRKTDSENITEGESGELKGQEQVLEELDDAPVVNVSDELVGEIKKLIGLYSLKEVKNALVFVESDL